MLSVKIPVALKKELEHFVDENHFLDISEAVRDFIRKKMHNLRDPYLIEIRRLRSSIAKNIQDEALRKSREQLILELRKIDNQLQGGFQ